MGKSHVKLYAGMSLANEVVMSVCMCWTVSVRTIVTSNMLPCARIGEMQFDVSSLHLLKPRKKRKKNNWKNGRLGIIRFYYSTNYAQKPLDCKIT